MKRELKPHEFLVDPKTTCLIPLAEYIYSLDFAEEPDYAKIKFLLTKNLLDVTLVPTLEYDWNYELWLKYESEKPDSTVISRESIDIKF